jgi:hypothetical protein
VSGQGRTSRQDVSTTLDAAVQMLEDSWTDLHRLRVYMAEYELLAGALSRYPGSAYIRDWYVAHLLMGCRRLVETGKDVITIRRALHSLRRIADELTAEDIAAHRRRRRTGADARVADVKSAIGYWIDGYTAGGPIGVSTVQKDLDRIKEVADRVQQIATRQVAHRLDAHVDSVTRDEVEQLLSDLQDIWVRWSNVLRGVDILDSPRGGLSRPLLRALELFDWHAYNKAIGDELRRRGPQTGWADVEADVRVEFTFDRPAAD